jgi:D-alanine-D-alanine ligase
MARQSPCSSERARIVLLHDARAAGGAPDAADVLAEAAYIDSGLRALGHETATVPVGLDLEALGSRLDAGSGDIAFNLMESLDGHARLIHVVPALLEALGIAFTGCSARAQWLTSNKLEAKRQLMAAGIATPPWVGHGARHALGRDDQAGQWIVKSVWEHASIGLDDESVVAFEQVPAVVARRQAEFGGEWFAERFIAGRELNVALISTSTGPRALPVAEIRFEGYPDDKPRIVGYAAKWQTDSMEYGATVRSFAVERTLCEAAVRVAKRCWDEFGLSGYARVDFRVDAAGRLWVLEINANPCLSPDAGFAAMLAEAQIPFAKALAWLVDDALRRAGRPEQAQTSAKDESRCFR